MTRNANLTIECQFHRYQFLFQVFQKTSFTETIFNILKYYKESDSNQLNISQWELIRGVIRGNKSDERSTTDMRMTPVRSMVFRRAIKPVIDACSASETLQDTVAVKPPHIPYCNYSLEAIR